MPAGACNMETATKSLGATPVDHANFVRCADVIKQMAGLPRKKSRPIRESIRNGSFKEMVGPEISCEILDNWPLREQLDFLKSVENMTSEEKIVHIYDKVYELWKSSVKLSVLEPQSQP